MPVVETVVTGDEEINGTEHEITQKKPAQAKPEVTTEAEATEEHAEEAPSIDYKAEYEKKTAQLKKAEFALYKKNKAAKKKAEPEDDGEEEENPVETKVVQILEQQRQRDAEDMIEEELLNIEDEDERELTRLHLESSIQRTGYSRAAVKNDIETANFLANKPRFQRERKEMKTTAISKRTMGTATNSPNQDKIKATSDYSKFFTKGDWEFMKKNPKDFPEEKIKKLIDNRK